ncbi:MAG: hypothetical protein Q8O67_13770 [Deltaproteobacteria bacterium]|nr:hypothetical protein [Deltaproteobacteria bacterium]
MLGFVVGSVCLVALVKLLRHGRSCGGGYGHRRHGCGGGGCGGGGGGWRNRHWGHHHHHQGQDRGYGGGYEGDFGVDDDRGGPVFLRSLFSQLETTPGQERVIIEGLKELKAAFGKAKAASRKSARDLGEALRGETLSMDSMGSVFASLDEGTDAVRNGSFSALTKIHEVLDERQRRILSDLIARGGGLQDLADAA